MEMKRVTIKLNKWVFTLPMIDEDIVILQEEMLSDEYKDIHWSILVEPETREWLIKTEAK